MEKSIPKTLDPSLLKMELAYLQHVHIYSPIQLKGKNIPNVDINIGMETRLSDDQRVIIIQVSIKLVPDLSSFEGLPAFPFPPICAIEPVFSFNYPELDGFWTEAENRIVFDENLITTLYSLAYSTTRGIFQQQARGTIFEGFILPIVAPQRLVGATATD